MNGQNRCFRTSVHLAPGAVSAHDSPYACRGEEVTFKCQVTHAASLEWASEPGILRNLPLSYTAFDEAGQTRRRDSYRSRLLSVTPSPPRSNFSSVLIFTPSPSVNSVRVVCGDQLASCSREEDYTFTIAGNCKCMSILTSHVYCKEATCRSMSFQPTVINTVGINKMLPYHSCTTSVVC